MKVTRITRMSAHRVFRDFTWPATLQPFGQFNLIYGWNGSGKTTFSSLFHHLQTRSAVAEGDVEFEIDGAKVSGRNLENARLPSIRVFNRDFIASTILAAGGRMNPSTISVRTALRSRSKWRGSKMSLTGQKRR